MTTGNLLPATYSPAIDLIEQVTFQERKIARLVLQEFSCKEISSHLGISVETVKKHRKNLIKKWGISGKAAFRRALRQFEKDL